VRKQYILFDWRALEDTEDAVAISVSDSLEQLIKEAEEDYGGVIYSYDVDENHNLLNEKFEESILAKYR
jgi:hypothetical protein